MTDVISDVTEFHRAMDVPVFYYPQFPDDARVELRRKLVEEEVFMELFAAIDNRDIIETADAIVDSVYVLVGMALEFGIPFDRVWAEVQRSNMAKVGPDGIVKRREDGKVLKPDGWTPPDIERVLFGPTDEGNSD